MSKCKDNINIKELMRPNTKIDKTDNIKLGEVAIKALGDLINRLLEHETITQISQWLKTTRQTCYNWSNYKAKTFNQERLESLSLSLEVEENLIKRFMIGQISLDELWAKTKYQKVSQKDSTFSETHDKIGRKKDIENPVEFSDFNFNAVIPKDLQNIISILIQLENPIIDKAMIVDSLIGYIKKLNIRDRLDLLAKIHSIIPEEQKATFLPTDDYLSDIGEVSFTLPIEVKGARKIVDMSYQHILQQKDNDPKIALDWFVNGGVPPLLLDDFFHEDKEATYPCGKKWNAKELSLLTNNIFCFLDKEDQEDGQCYLVIKTDKTYANNFSRFFYDARKIANKHTIISEMINECMDKKGLTEAKIQPLISSLGISPQRWHQIQGGNEQPLSSEINAIIAVVDINYEFYSREKWLEQVASAPPEPIDTPKTKKFLVSSKFLEDDEPLELVIASLNTSLQQIKEGKIHPISELWDGIDV